DSSPGFVIRAQRITAGGSRAWDPAGSVIASGPGLRYPTSIAADDGGGAFVTWVALLPDPSQPLGLDYVSRVDSTGSVASGWGAGGVRLSRRGVSQASPLVVAGGASGAVVAWQEMGDTASGWAQSFSGTG